MENINFVYGYEMRNGQNRPTITAAIVPVRQSDGIYFGIGIARCSMLDQINKVKGRTIATARAFAVIKNPSYILSKPDMLDDGYQDIIGLLSKWPVATYDLGHDGLNTRIFNCCEYLARKMS